MPAFAAPMSRLRSPSWRWILTITSRPDLAAAFVDAYVTGERRRRAAPAARLLRCYRAYVRGKVLSLRLSEPSLAPSEERNVTAAARAYFSSAADHATGGETTP